jgi:hypothetical protein
VPAAAILFSPTGLRVAVVGQDNKITFNPVTIAKDDGDVVELGSGVNPGDRVALNISSAVANGDEVNVVDDTKNMLARFAAENRATPEPPAQNDGSQSPAAKPLAAAHADAPASQASLSGLSGD